MPRSAKFGCAAIGHTITRFGVTSFGVIVRVALPDDGALELVLRSDHEPPKPVLRGSYVLAVMLARCGS
jgi:hypothetical protein